MLPIDPSQLPQNVTANLFASGLIWLMVQTPSMLGFSDDDTQKAEDLIKEALDDLAYNYQWEHEVIRFEEVGNFLATQEARMLMRQLYSYTLITDELKKEADISPQQMRENFVQTMAHYFDVSPEAIKDSATALYEDFVRRTEKILQKAIESGLLTAVDVRTTRRHYVLMDELRAIKKILRFHTEGRVVSIEDINRFEAKYREQVSLVEGKITPPSHRGKRHKIDLDAIYVLPDFQNEYTMMQSLEKISELMDQITENLLRSMSDKEEVNVNEVTSFAERIQFRDIFPAIYRNVLLGDPGAGKSTFTQKLCYDLSKPDNRNQIARRRLTPMRVVLRDYNKSNNQSRCSILQYIEEKSETYYQVKPPAGAIEYLLLKGRAIVIFDGLDELLESNQRRIMTDKVEAFCNLYPSVPVVVTSRRVGYQQAPLDEERFEVIKLAPFNKGQIEEYSENWFTHNPDIRNFERKNLINSFLNDLKFVPDEVKQSPLMLSLLCGMYRGSGYLPQNRPDIYEACSKMLFEQWDAMRGIKENLPFEHHVPSAMRYLANWIYRNADLQSGVTKRKLVDKTKEYLLNRRYTDEDEAHAAAGKFVDFCKGRAWVFTDTGTDERGRPLYQFTHRTFLEYFTAEYLVRTLRTPDDLLDELMPRIRREEWQVVSELIFQLQDQQHEGDADLLISGLLNRAESDEIPYEDQVRCILFALKSAEFLVLSPVILSQLMDACLNILIDAKEMHKRDFLPDATINLNVFNYLSRVNFDNVKHMQKAAIDYLAGLSNAMIEKRSLLIFEIASLPDRAIPFSLNEQVLKFWKPISQEVKNHYAGYFEEWMTDDKVVAIEFFRQNKINLETLIELHGFPVLFHERQSQLFIGTTSSLTMNILLSFLHSGKEPGFYISPSILKKATLPLSTSTGHILNNISSLMDATDRSKDEITVKAWFTIFVILISFAVEQSFADFLFAHHDKFSAIKHTILARYKPAEHLDHVQAELDAIGFADEQQEFIWQWVRGEIDFVEPDDT